MKTIYSTPASESTDEARISVLQNTLSQLRLANIATLDALMTHFTRLIELTSADETYIAALATSLAPCILRPRTETSMTMEEKYSYRLIRDLFSHKNTIFSELKRASSLSHTISVETRPRSSSGVSTDESNRKANMEARARAIIAAGGTNRGRDKSPVPSPRGHRRDRSSGGPETRFPIVSPSPTLSSHGQTPRQNTGPRSSLEVPGESAPSTPADPTYGPDSPLKTITNGAETSPPMSAPYVPSVDEGLDSAGAGVEKRNSLNRSGPAGGSGRFPGRKGLSRMGVEDRKRDSAGSQIGEDGARVGVSLTDKAMDD